MHPLTTFNQNEIILQLRYNTFVAVIGQCESWSSELGRRGHGV